MAITAIATPKRRGRKPGPGLSIVPRGYFLDSNAIKTANRMSNRLVTFSALINVALHRCPTRPYQTGLAFPYEYERIMFSGGPS
jgi:hypothetical protein